MFNCYVAICDLQRSPLSTDTQQQVNIPALQNCARRQGGAKNHTHNSFERQTQRGYAKANKKVLKTIKKILGSCRNPNAPIFFYFLGVWLLFYEVYFLNSPDVTHALPLRIPENIYVFCTQLDSRNHQQQSAAVPLCSNTTTTVHIHWNPLPP